jgi:hypothetical protein
MNIAQYLIEDCPLTSHELLKYIKEKENIIEDDNLYDALLDVTIRLLTPRAMIEFFDDKGYYMIITRTANKWQGFVAGEVDTDIQFLFDTREEAEYECAVHILNVMEEKLAKE